MDYKYKPGDKVIVARITEGRDYYMHSGFQMDHPWQSGFGITVSSASIGRRKDLEGKAVTILEHYRNRYIIDETDSRVLWTDDMFVGLNNEDECYCNSLL